MKVILASQSPRRKELLPKIVSDFQIIPSTVEEHSTLTDPPKYVQELAFHKATDVFGCNSDAVVIGCDTVVALDGQILGKPKTAAQATEMLQSLSGKTHFVHTGVCILSQNQTFLFCDTTAVTFRSLTAEEIANYVSGGSPMDKAGAYGIQDCDFVESYAGSYDNVVGFPTERVAEILDKIYKG